MAVADEIRERITITIYLSKQTSSVRHPFAGVYVAIDLNLGELKFSGDRPSLLVVVRSTDA